MHGRTGGATTTSGTALAQIMGTDCRLADELILCRNLAPEVGSSCLTGGFPPVPPVPPGPQPGGPILDYPGLDAAHSGFSLRRLRTAYTGPLIELRRSSDNATTDIYPGHNGLVDLDAIATFSQGSDCFVTGWYDQGQNDVYSPYQPAPSRQGKLYDNITGFVLNSSNALAVKLDGVDDFYSTPLAPLVPFTSRFLGSMALEPTGGGGDMLWDHNINPPGGSGKIVIVDTYSGDRIRSYIYGDQIFTDGPVFNTPVVISCGGQEVAGTIFGEIRQNGKEDDAGSPGLSTFVGACQLVIGASSTPAQYLEGYLSEFIYYDDVDYHEVLPELGLELVEALEQNMMETWGVTPATP